MREDLLEQQDDDAQEDFEVDEDDVELDGEDAEEWTGFSQPEQEDSAPEDAAVETASPADEEEAQPVASTSKPIKETAKLLAHQDYEQPFDGELPNLLFLPLFSHILNCFNLTT